MDADTTIRVDRSDAKLKLLLYTAMPASESAWNAGFEAARFNGLLDENPYTGSDDEYKCWVNGWWAGFYDDDYLAEDVVNVLVDYKSDKYKFSDGYGVPSYRSIASTKEEFEEHQNRKYSSKFGFKTLLAIITLLSASLFGMLVLID